MQLVCSRCGTVHDYGAKRPSFCSECGQPFPADGPPTITAPPPIPQTLTFDSQATGPEGRTGAPDTPPAVIGGYRLLRRLGGGGMGSVYEAEDANGRRVAIKLIAARYARSTEAVERFRREGRLASLLTHPRCVFVLAADEDQDRPYIVMELMPGRTLKDEVEESGPLPVETAVSKVLDVIEGLEEAHALGIVHRDVKPSNCFLDAEGRVKVGDFGLSKSLTSDAQLSRPGGFLGTPLFASPEQIKGQPVDARADLYSVAATLYFALTGQAPFQGESGTAVMARIVSEPAPPLRSRRSDIPVSLERVVMRGLERDPAKRWRRLTEFRDALLPFVPGRLSRAGMGLRLGAILTDGVIVWFAWVLILMTATLTGLVRGPADFGAPPKPEPPSAAPPESPPAPPPPVEEPKREDEVRFFGAILYPILALVYLFLCEVVWAGTPGKWLLGLRLCKASGTDPPGILRVLARVIVFYALVLLPFDVVMSRTRLMRAWLDQLLGRGSTLLWPAVGVGVMALPMRPRNGYRGLHEFVSGTRVVTLTRPPVLRLPAIDFELPVVACEKGPEQIGPFRIDRVLRSAGESQFLLATDEELERSVWLWLRPRSAPELSRSRREIGRSTRLRWLASGVEGDRQWDAFVAPTGGPLPALIDRGVSLTWTQARPILEQLTEELKAAEADGTLPATLSCQQVWVQPNGRVVLLDEPLTGIDEHSYSASSGPLDLVRRAALLLLEGRVRAEGTPPERVVHALPLHAASMLDRLFDVPDRYERVDQLGDAFAATRDRPTEVTRSRRLAHLLVLAACIYAAMLGNVVVGLLLLQLIAFLQEVTTGKRIDGCAMFFLALMVIGISILAVPPVGIITAFLLRGTLSFRFMDLAIVRYDGLRASRWRCAWRAILFWAPLCGALYLDAVGGKGVVTTLTLVAYVAMAMAWPRRSLHDYLAGTVLVPR